MSEAGPWAAKPWRQWRPAQQGASCERGAERRDLSVEGVPDPGFSSRGCAAGRTGPGPAGSPRLDRGWKEGRQGASSGTWLGSHRGPTGRGGLHPGVPRGIRRPTRVGRRCSKLVTRLPPGHHSGLETPATADQHQRETVPESSACASMQSRPGPPALARKGASPQTESWAITRVLVTISRLQKLVGGILLDPNGGASARPAGSR